MSGLGIPVLINQNRSYWLSSIGNDVIHSTIQVQELDASIGRFSTLFSDSAAFSTLNVSTLSLQNSDVSGMYVSSIRGNTAFFSTVTLASDLSGGVGYVRFSVDASGIQVDGDPIRFDNLVYLTSTINIVQVSTIVDTDIFAQNGYFSTLSTQVFNSGANFLSSIVCNDISGTYGSFDTLFVSSLEALDISGVAASNWSLYPTLNSSITFQPSYVLSNVGPSLYFAGVELTDVSGGGQDWSRFPAISTVQMNNNSLIGLSTLQFQDTGKLYSVTGNNLFYNGQPIQFGSASNVSQWANYNAVNNVNMNNFSLNNANGVSTTNLSVLSNFYNNDYTWLNTLEVGGTTLTPLMAVTSGGDVVCRNLQVGDNVTSLADVEIYGATALPGDSALYVEGGVQFDGGTIHGFSAGVLPVAGVNTGRVEVLQAGFNLLHPLVGAITTGAALGITAGGALSLAGGSYIEANSSDFNIINTTSGNQSTTLTVANIQMPASVAATVPLQINNTAGGGINLVGTSGAGNIAGFSSITGDNLISLNSTITNNLYVSNNALFNFGAWNNALGVSTTIGALRVNNIQIPDNITGVTNAPNPLQSRINNFSSIQSFNMSTTDFWVSSINGQPIDASGGTFINTNKFSTLFTSSFKTSTMSGYPLSGVVPLSTIVVEGGLQFTGDYQGNPQSSRFLSSVRNINSFGQPLTISAGASNQEFALLFPAFLGGNTQYVRVGSGSAFDTKIRNYGGGQFGAVSTCHVMTSSIIGDPTSGVDISGNLVMKGNITLPTTNNINFSDGTTLGSGLLINQSMPCFTDGGPAGCNLGAVAANQFLIGSGTGAFGAAKLYCDFPGDNWGVDIIDAGGVTLFETLNCYDTGGYNFQTNLYGVSSIVGYTPNTPPGGATAVGIGGILTAPEVSTPSLMVSTINGMVHSPVTNQFSTLFTSSFAFSTMASAGSNAGYNYPIYVDWDQANNLSTGGVAIAVQGHNFGLGAVVNRIEMGCRGNGNNYITSVWPGQNLEDLYIDATDVYFNDGTISTIINSDPYGVVSNRGISAPSLLVSSINGVDARCAFTNNIQLSSMTLYQNSTTLMYWDSVTTSSNINTSGYDVVAGLNGTFKIGTSLQFQNQSGTDKVEFFFVKNDVPITNGGGIINVLNNDELLTYCEIIEPLNNGDKIQVGCYTTSADVNLSTVQGTVIESPAAILTMYKIC